MCAVNDKVYTCGIDDSVKQIDVASKAYIGADTKLGSQPRGMDIKNDIIVVGCMKEVSTLLITLDNLVSVFFVRGKLDSGPLQSIT